MVLALGGLLALLLNDREPRRSAARRSYTIILIAVGLFALSFPAWDRRLLAGLSRIVSIPSSDHHLALHSARRLLVNLGFLSVVGVCVINAGRPALGWLRERRLAYLGQISYGLYLYHLIVFRISDNLVRAHGFGERVGLDALKIALTFAALAAAFVAAFIEHGRSWRAQRIGLTIARRPQSRRRRYPNGRGWILWADYRGGSGNPEERGSVRANSLGVGIFGKMDGLGRSLAPFQSRPMARTGASPSQDA